MRIEFDPANDEANRAKHGVSLSLAAELDWDAALVWVNDRLAYGELRMALWYAALLAGSSACVEPIVARFATMSKASKPTVVMPSVAEDRAITAAAKSDPDAQPLTGKQLDSMIPLRGLRGRPKSANPKQLVSVRYSPEVLAYFRSTGEGWQSRMDRVLRQYVTRQSRRA